MSAKTRVQRSAVKGQPASLPAVICIAQRCGGWFASVKFGGTSYLGGEYESQALAVSGAALVAVSVGAKSVELVAASGERKRKAAR